MTSSTTINNNNVSDWDEMWDFTAVFSSSDDDTQIPIVRLAISNEGEVEAEGEVEVEAEIHSKITASSVQEVDVEAPPSPKHFLGWQLGKIYSARQRRTSDFSLEVKTTAQATVKR